MRLSKPWRPVIVCGAVMVRTTACRSTRKLAGMRAISTIVVGLAMARLGCLTRLLCDVGFVHAVVECRGFWWSVSLNGIRVEVFLIVKFILSLFASVSFRLWLLLFKRRFCSFVT